MKSIIIILSKMIIKASAGLTQLKIEAILHPTRIQIIQLLAREPMTVQEMLEELPITAQASLYRHLNALKKNAIVRVAEEKQVRGTVEKRYALNEKETTLTREEAGSLTKEEHMRYFMTFFTIVLQQVETYLEGEVDFEKDGFGYHQLDLKLTEKEYEEFLNDYRSLLKHYSKKNSEDGTKRTISNIIVPENRPYRTEKDK